MGGKSKVVVVHVVATVGGIMLYVVLVCPVVVETSNASDPRWAASSQVVTAACTTPIGSKGESQSKRR